jgi:hypothetical protein
MRWGVVNDSPRRRGCCLKIGTVVYDAASLSATRELCLNVGVVIPEAAAESLMPGGRPECDDSVLVADAVSLRRGRHP